MPFAHSFTWALNFPSEMPRMLPTTMFTPSNSPRLSSPSIFLPNR